MVTVLPTGTGKTLMAKAALFRAFHRRESAVYTTPLRALTEEKYRELGSDFGEGNVGFATGDFKNQSRSADPGRGRRDPVEPDRRRQGGRAGRCRHHGRGSLLQRPRARLRVGAIDHRARSARPARRVVGDGRSPREVLSVGRGRAPGAARADRLARAQGAARPRVPRGRC